MFLLVATEVEEITRIEANLSKKCADIAPVVFCLTKVDLIPFDRAMLNLPSKTKDQIEKVKKKVKKYLQYGFFFAQNFDITISE